ncbi:hypothetical protein AB0K48_20635 [Nonomuraea sp. NPDC055795]
MLGLLLQVGERGGMVVLVGSSGSGKTRSAWELVRQTLPGWWLWHPRDAAHVRQYARRPQTKVVVWLDELHTYLREPGGLDAGTIRALLHAGNIVIATLRPSHHGAYLTAPASGLHEDPEQANAGEILKLAETMHVSDSFSAAEVSRAQVMPDWRLKATLRQGRGQVTPWLAGAPQLMARWRSADPYVRAVLRAALEASATGPIEAQDLHQMASSHCDAQQRATAPPDWFDSAIAYATAPVAGRLSLLTPISSAVMGKVTSYAAADHLAWVIALDQAAHET